MIKEEEAALLAKHIVKLMYNELFATAQVVKRQVSRDVTDELFDTRQAAEYLHTTTNALKKNLSSIPHHQSQKGGKLLFFKSELTDYVRHNM